MQDASSDQQLQRERPRQAQLLEAQEEPEAQPHRERVSELGKSQFPLGVAGCRALERARGQTSKPPNRGRRGGHWIRPARVFSLARAQLKSYPLSCPHVGSSWKTQPSQLAVERLKGHQDGPPGAKWGLTPPVLVPDTWRAHLGGHPASF